MGERHVLATRLSSSGARLASTEWCGPSKHGEGRKTCEGESITSPLVLGCVDGTKQYAVTGIVSWLKTTQNATIKPQDVHVFDDRVNNIQPFSGTGYNAAQVSCATRDVLTANVIGLCGASESEIVEGTGVHLCANPSETEPKPEPELQL